MKNIFFLFVVVLCLQACSGDDDKNWDADGLSVTVSGDFATLGESFNAGDGNWGVNMDPRFEGALSLDIQTNKAWSIDIEYLTDENEEWLTPSATEGNGKTSVIVTVNANPTEYQRKATLTITTLGEIPTHKKITVIQNNLGVLHITWTNSFLFSDNEMVFGPTSREGIVIGIYDSKGDEVDLSATPDWINIVLEDGKVILSLSAWEGEGESKNATLTLTNLNGGISKSVTITQYASENIAPKSNWTIEAGNDKTTCTNSEPFKNIIDDDIHTHWQWGWNNGDASDFPNTPYEFIIDLGSPQLFNSFYIWQTQLAENGFVKDVQFKVSDNREDWINLGTYRMSDSSDDAIAHGDNPYIFDLPGVYNKQYIRLMILSNVGDSKVNYFKNAYLGELSVYLK